MTRDRRNGEITVDAVPGNEAAAQAMLYTRADNNVRTQG
jgi:hypothetical protein